MITLRAGTLAGVVILALAACAAPPGPELGPADLASPEATVPPAGVEAMVDTIPAIEAEAALPDVQIVTADLTALGADRLPPPVQVTSADLSIDMPVVPAGLRDDGQVEVPPGTEKAGWYRFGAAPGADEGTAVLFSHVDTRDGLGPFANIHDAREGDRITVTLEDGTTAVYEVFDRQQVYKPDLDVETLFREDGPSRLALVTCGGVWIPERLSYEDNVIVYAKRVG